MNFDQFGSRGKFTAIYVTLKKIKFYLSIKMEYRKLPLKNTGDINNLPDGTILVKNHWFF